MRLNDEFVWLNETGHEHVFTPFSVAFYTNNANSSLSVEPTFGLVYLRETLLDLGSVNRLGDKFIFEVNVYCRIRPTAENYARLAESSRLYRTTRLVFSISKAVVNKQVGWDEIVLRPIWRETRAVAQIAENVPGGSFLEQFTVASHINTEVLTQIQRLTVFSTHFPTLNYFLKSSPDAEFFEMEAHSGYIRTRANFEPDYEHASFHDLTIIACVTQTQALFEFKTNTACFEQELALRIRILNTNDNEPRLKLHKTHKTVLNLYNTSELVRALSLFEFEIEDLDADLTEISYKVVHVATKNECAYAKFGADSFQLYPLGNELKNQVGLQLSDWGYDNLVKLVDQHDQDCMLNIEIVCQASDGLFSNRISFELNLKLGSHDTSLLSIRDSPVVPILHTIEFDENTRVAKDTRLANISQTLVNYLHANLNHTVQSEDENHGYLSNEQLIRFKLRNHQDLFRINSTENALYVRRNATFDRELELFVDVALEENESSILKEKHLIPARFRILVKIRDINDNAPVFYFPAELKLSRNTYNHTYKWEDFLSSNASHPLCHFKAFDLDSGVNSQIIYEITGSSVDDIFEINARSGQLYSNQRMNQINSLVFWRQRHNDLIVTLNITARDPQLSASVSVRLHFVWSVSPESVYFEPSFFAFSIPESIPARKVFGRVDSAVYFESPNRLTSNIIYAIVAGDEFDEFEIDFRTGELSARVSLDYERVATYYLTVRAYDSMNPIRGQHANATVRVDLVDVNDNAPEFDRYEYRVEVNESVSKMSELFRVRAQDADSPNSTNSQVRYKLLNNFDTFYINELTGIVYNKIAFDYEASRASLYADGAEASIFLATNLIHLNIVAYDLGDSPVDLGNNRTLVAKSLETSCVLSIRVLNVNDNAPQFEKAVYYSQLEVDSSELDLKSAFSSMLDLLSDETTSKTSINSFQFVTKVNAKDVDSTRLTYSIVRQTPEDETTQHLVAETLFSIEPHTGIVYLNLRDFLLYKEFNSASSKFDLQLSVSDSVFTSLARLTVHVKNVNSAQITRPTFKESLVKLNFNFKQVEKSRLLAIIELKSQLTDSFLSKQVAFSLNSDSKRVLAAFSIENTLLEMNVEEFLKQNEFVYQLPVLACDQTQTGLCDQMIVRLNFTDVPVISRHEGSKQGNIAETFGFAYNYWAITIQQQASSVASVISEDLNADYDVNSASSTEDEEYYMDENYESNERFYFDIRTKDVLVQDEEDYETQKKSKYEFELASCVFTGLNLSFTNASLSKQVKQLSHGLSPRQLRSLFSLNRHNGVLSSRKIINTIVPGVYQFEIHLKTKTGNKHALVVQLFQIRQRILQVSL